MYAVVLRKLELAGNFYYQLIDKVIGQESFDSKLEVINDGKYQGNILEPVQSFSNYVYLEVEKDVYDQISDGEILFLKVIGGSLQKITDFNEESNVALNFYKRFRDFKLVPDYDVKDLLSQVQYDLKTKLLGQEKPIQRIISKIYTNQMYLETDLQKDDMVNNKSNILLLGPTGTGKSTIKESLKENLSPLPVVECQLTGNFQKDITDMIRKLIKEADGNQYLAERGIVIFDGINQFNFMNIDTNSGEIVYYLEVLKQIMNSKYVSILTNNDEYSSFDSSLLTYMCIVDVDYDFEEDPDFKPQEGEESYLYYSYVKSSQLYELGFSGDMISTYFANEIIYMNPMTKNLALKIMQHKEISPIYKLKKVLESHNKTLKIESGFISKLVEYGLRDCDGITGIIRRLKYLVEAHNYEANRVFLRKKDLDTIEVGSFIVDDDIIETTNESRNNYDGLKIDLKKRTINDLKIMDVVEKICQKVKGQREQIFQVVNAFYNHVFIRQQGFNKIDLREMKENVLLIGKTGVGKTAILLNLTSIFDLPYVRISAPRYSKSGYVGADVDSILWDLIDAASGDISKAENGILLLDELDKIKSSKDSNNVDMSLGVQNELLTLIEGDKRTITRRIGYGDQSVNFDTSNLFVIGSGAFAGLEKITERRVKKELGLTTIGFRENKSLVVDLNPNNKDLEEYGFDSQFTARFHHKVRLTSLNPSILYDIINNKDGGILTLTKKAYAKSGIKLVVEDGFKQKLAEEAYKKGEGARSINGVFSEIKTAIDRNIQSGDVREVILSAESLSNVDTIKYVKRKNRKS